MTLDQRRDMLQKELFTLMDLLVDYHLADPHRQIENPFRDRLEQQLQEKTKELESLNAQARSPLYRFWRASRDLLLPIWIAVISVCAVSLFLLAFPLIAAPWVTVLSVTVSVLCLAWAIWSSRSPYK